MLGEFSGRPLQVLLNPHGIISRMNIGQLLETHLGWLLHRGYPEKDLLLPTDSNHPCGFPAIAIDRLNHEKIHEKIQMLLKASGLDETGKIPLVLPDGGETLSPVMVGFEHIVRLAHIPMLKAQARRGGKGYSYDSKTGQAVHGRKRGGGQRIGEMEVWALAAYQANHILDEMLEKKSSRILQMTNPQPPADSTYLEFLKAWLRAMMIDWEDTSDGFRLSFVTTDNVNDFIKSKLGGIDKEVTEPQALTARLLADFQCGTKGCVDNHYGECLKQVKVPNGPKTTADSFSLKLDWLLYSCGFVVKSIEKKVKVVFSLKLERLDKPSQSVTATFDIVKYDPAAEKPKHCLQAELTFDEGAELPDGIPSTIYCRADGREKTAKELLTELPNKNSLEDFNVVCAKHQSKPLKYVSEQAPKKEKDPFQESKGIFDPEIFGNLEEISSTKWGYIRLPVEIKYPLLNETDEHTHLIDIIPVLPVSYRVPLGLHGGKLQDDEFGYKAILKSCQDYKKADEDKKEDAKKNLETSVKNLFDKLSERLQGKEGFIRNKGLGRRVDRSSRMVIAPNPELNWGQVGLSSAVLWELMGDLVIRAKSSIHLSEATRVKISELPADDPLRILPTDREVSAETLEKRLKDWNWQKTARDLDYDIQTSLLKDYLKAYPDTLVLLNRQPSLHRYNFHAFHPVVLSHEIGDVIQLSPLACKDFAADFDGDEMVVHFPLSPEAQKEAKRLLPSQNLVSLANGSPTAHYDQDFVMGTYWLKEKKKPEMLREKFLELLGKYGPEEKSGEKLLKDICADHAAKGTKIISEWMRLAFEACTKVGVSFGYYDFKSLEIKDKDDWSNLEISKFNDTLGNAVKDKLDVFVQNNDCDAPG